MSSFAVPQQANFVQPLTRASTVPLITKNPADHKKMGKRFVAGRRVSPKAKPSNLYILVLDRQEIYFEGLSAVFANVSRIHLVGHATSGAGAVARDYLRAPNVAVVSTSLPWRVEDDTPVSPQQLFPALLRRFPDLLIIPLYDAGEEHLAARMMSLDAQPPIERDIQAEQLRERFLSYLADSEDTDAAQSPSTAADSQTLLTKRQYQVLLLLAQGLTDSQIAERLNTSVGTARKHAEHVRAKLKVNSRTAAVAKARDIGLI